MVYLVPAIRIILGVLFFAAGALKLPALRKFSVVVASYGLLPRVLVKPLSYVQPFVELFTGIWFLSGINVKFAAILGFLLMLSANVFVLYGLIQKKKLENCGCYGSAIKVPLSWKKFAENLVWTGLCVVLFFSV